MPRTKLLNTIFHLRKINAKLTYVRLLFRLGLQWLPSPPPFFNIYISYTYLILPYPTLNLHRRSPLPPRLLSGFHNAKLMLNFKKTIFSFFHNFEKHCVE